MRKETGASQKNTQKDLQQDSGTLHAVGTSDAIDPITPPKKEYQPGTGVADEPEIKAGGVDKFISDFKKEVENISSTQRKPVVSEQKIKDPSPAEPPTSGVSKEKEPIDSEDMQHYVSNIIEIVAEKVAKSIVEKIDRKELYKLLQEQMSKKLKKWW